MHQALMLYDAIVESDYSNLNPLKERTIWSRGKICYDLFLERGGDYQKKISDRDLSELAKIYQDDKRVAVNYFHKHNQEIIIIINIKK
ncbi:MAG: hypothetical protein HGB14_02500 [Anaerolineaceae bacterium]|nr:hypothetical protein [Anaerolineaceae bacterium]